MEGMAKTATEAQPEPVVTTTPSVGVTSGEIQASPEVLSFFQQDATNPSAEFDYVNSWIRNNADTALDGLVKMRDFEVRLGQPSVGETRLSQMYNYLHMKERVAATLNVNEIKLTKVRERHEELIARISENHEGRMGKITTELARAERDYDRALRNHDLNATNRSRAIKEQFEVQVKELNKLFKVYGGNR